MHTTDVHSTKKVSSDAVSGLTTTAYTIDNFLLYEESINKKEKYA